MYKIFETRYHYSRGTTQIALLKKHHFSSIKPFALTQHSRKGSTNRYSFLPFNSGTTNLRNLSDNSHQPLPLFATFDAALSVIVFIRSYYNILFFVCQYFCVNYISATFKRITKFYKPHIPKALNNLFYQQTV